MRWIGMEKLKEKPFKRLTGVGKSTFLKMAACVAERRAQGEHCKGSGKRGPTPGLSAEDELLMMLMYYREYRSLEHIGLGYDLSEAQPGASSGGRRSGWPTASSSPCPARRN